MFDLPLSWNSIFIPFVNPRKVIYGYQCDFNNKAYSIYITDFKNVWLERLSKQDIIDKANSYGIEDTEDEKLHYLLEVLRNGVECGDVDKTLLFSITKINRTMSDNENTIQAKFTGEIDWDFSVVKQSPSNAIDVISQINFQQFENHNYLNYKVEQLERLINIKDHYIIYLSENYKAINGDELIKKYRKNNKADAKYLHKYDRKLWSRKTENSYMDVVKKEQNSNENWYDKVWLSIEKSINDKRSWIFSKTFAADTSNEPIHIKQETDESLELSEDKPTPIIKKESSDISPKKRPVVRKIGIIGPRKRKLESSTNNAQNVSVNDDANKRLTIIKEE